MNSVDNKKGKVESYIENNRKFRGRIKFWGTAFVSALTSAIIAFGIFHGPNFSTNAPEKELDSTKVVTQNTDKEFENRINEDSTDYQFNGNANDPVTGSIETHVATSRDATVVGVGGEVTFHGDNTATSINAGIDKTISHDPDSKEGLLNVSAGVGNTWYFDNENSVSLNVEGDLDISNGGKVNGGGIKAGVSHTTPLGESNNTITYGGFVGYKTDGGAYGGVGATIKFGENKNTPKKTFVNDGDGFKLVEKNASTTPDNPNPDNPSQSKPNINTPTNPQEPVR